MLHIAAFIRSLLPSFGKSDIESDLEISLENIPVIVDAYNSAGDVLLVTQLNDPATKELVKHLYRELDAVDNGVKLERVKNLGKDTVALFANVKVNAEYMMREIEDAFNDVIMSQALTAYKANLLRVVPHLYFMTRYALDMLNYIYIKEAEAGGVELGKGYRLTKKQEIYVTSNIWNYARLLALYGSKPEKFLNKLKAISEVTIPQDKAEEIADLHRISEMDLINSLPNKFVGSPIYSVRLIFSQWEADRYRHMKDKRKLLELRLLHLKLLREQGSSDIAIEKEIESLQESITDIDYKLTKIEEDVNG